jgi:hypothetical protein
MNQDLQVVSQVVPVQTSTNSEQTCTSSESSVVDTTTALVRIGEIQKKVIDSLIEELITEELETKQLKVQLQELHAKQAQSFVIHPFHNLDTKLEGYESQEEPNEHRHMQDKCMVPKKRSKRIGTVQSAPKKRKRGSDLGIDESKLVSWDGDEYVTAKYFEQRKLKRARLTYKQQTGLEAGVQITANDLKQLKQENCSVSSNANLLTLYDISFVEYYHQNDS